MEFIFEPGYIQLDIPITITLLFAVRFFMTVLIVTCFVGVIYVVPGGVAPHPKPGGALFPLLGLRCYVKEV